MMYVLMVIYTLDYSDSTTPCWCPVAAFSTHAEAEHYLNTHQPSEQNNYSGTGLLFMHKRGYYYEIHVCPLNPVP